jgi:flagellar biosynthesis anti-sigma factor FlgM
MKIDHTNHLQPPQKIESRSDDSSPVSIQADAAPDDRSTLSTLAHHLTTSSDLRQQRIEALRVAVESGTYEVSATDLAASLIDAHSTRP